jgi:hypothetical protein
MKRLINPSVDELNAAYKTAKAQGKLVIETIERDFRFKEIDFVQQWVGVPDGVQVIYILTRKELHKFKRNYDVIYGAAA